MSKHQNKKIKNITLDYLNEKKDELEELYSIFYNSSISITLVNRKNTKIAYHQNLSILLYTILNELLFDRLSYRKKESLNSKSRKREYIDFRHIFCFLGYQLNITDKILAYSLVRDRTTIINSRNQAQDLLKMDRNFKSKFLEIKNLVYNDSRFIEYTNKK